MRATDSVFLIHFERELFEPVLPDSFQQLEAWCSLMRGDDPQQALVDEALQPFQDVEVAGRRCCGGNLLCRREGEAAGEDGQRAEKRPLLGGQEVVAPGDGLAQRPLPLRQIPRAACQQLQPPLQPGKERVRAEEPHPCRGQLDGERQSIQAMTDLGHRRGGRVVDRKVRAAPPAPVR